MVITEPVPDVLEELGWTGGECITDSRHMINYFRTTRDGRIAFGWGGGKIVRGANVHGHAEIDPEVTTDVQAHLRRFFPQLGDRAVTHAWGGPIDVSPTHLPMIRTVGDRSFAGFGYTGHGVGPSQLVGHALASMALDRRDDFTACRSSIRPRSAFRRSRSGSPAGRSSAGRSSARRPPRSRAGPRARSPAWSAGSRSGSGSTSAAEQARRRIPGGEYDVGRRVRSDERGVTMEGSPMAKGAEGREMLRGLARFWWLWLVFGIGWVLISLVILQFDQASITTVGVLIGLMFFISGIQQFAIAGMVERGGWLFVLFGFLFVIAGVIAFISPENTFAAIADILGFLFLIVGIFWIIQAFAERDENDVWWLGLGAGVLMVILAFWTGGQFFIEKQYTLLVFAGIWALMSGVTDIVRAFQIRKLKDL